MHDISIDTWYVDVVDFLIRGTSYDIRPRCGVKGFDMHLLEQSDREKCRWLKSWWDYVRLVQCRPYLYVNSESMGCMSQAYITLILVALDSRKVSASVLLQPCKALTHYTQ